jgi:hypothetical protein
MHTVRVSQGEVRAQEGVSIICICIQGVRTPFFPQGYFRNKIHYWDWLHVCMYQTYLFSLRAWTELAGSERSMSMLVDMVST